MVELKTPLVVAAIDVGASAIRMEISEIHADGMIRTLENLSKSVSLGKDAFTTGHLSEETLQTSCQALSDFSNVLKTYGVTKYRAVATSALREAGNADTFIDRVFLRCGIDIEIIDGSEENRLTYMTIHEAVKGIIDLQSKNALVVEVGGGSTDISLLLAGEPVHSGTFALGAVRIRQALLGVKGDLKHRRRIMDRQVKNAVDTIANTIPFSQVDEMITLGGDIRFAAKQVLDQELKPNGNNFWIIEKKDFHKFCNEVVRYDTDELARRYSLIYPEAETLVPALLVYRNIADRTKVERLHVLSASIRAGLLLDMTRREFGKELQSFDKLIVASARALARKYCSNENHMEQVKKLSLTLFDQLQAEHGLEKKERLLLEVAALLHDIGTFVNDRSHHKHTQYIINSSEIFGLSRSDLNLIGNIARYHRKSPPIRTHAPYVSLDRDSRMIVCKLAAILRIAEALDQDHSSKVRNLRLAKEEERYVLELDAEGDLTMERLSLEARIDLFKEIYGKPIVIA